MTPEQEQQVARALAETAQQEPTTPLPDGVVARLDDVLAELTAVRRRTAERTGDRDTDQATGEPTALAGVRSTQRRDGAPGAPGAPRAPRAPGAHGASGARRDRRWPRVLVAAAAVAVIAAAGAAVVTDGFGARPTTSADGGATSGSAADSRTDSGAGPESAGAGGGDGSAGGSARSLADGTTPRLRSTSLARDIRRVTAGVPTDAAGGRPTGCVLPARGDGDRLLAVRLDGRRATLLLRAPHDGTRAAEVFACGNAGTPVAATRVPAP